eukprot:2784259-Alexandrium_andersonii.AAC.1
MGSEGPAAIRTPNGAARLIDLGGEGDCAWRSLAFAGARAKGESDTEELRKSIAKMAVHLRTKVA